MSLSNLVMPHNKTTLDRYLNGQQVPYTDLRKVWTDVVGWVPTVTGLGYANFFAQVREVNLGLPPERRIHVWLGEPPITWSKIKTKADFQPILAQRDTHAAEVIEKKILALNKKAIVIYGGLHFYNNLGLRRLVEKSTRLHSSSWRSIRDTSPILHHEF